MTDEAGERSTDGGGSPPPPWIDMHPHLFNAYDVPVTEFIAKAVRPRQRKDGSDDDEFNWKVGERVARLTGGAPSIADDRAELRRRAEGSGSWDATWYIGMYCQAIKSRIAMLETLDYITGGRRKRHPFDLFVPLGVDMEPGVDGHGGSSPSEQFAFMEELSAATIRGHIETVPGFVLPVVGYHPERDDEDPRNSWPAIQARVETGRAVGIKLYPPMGFLPIGNRKRSLDDRLHAVYEWCEREHVPVVAHCSPANAIKGAHDFARAANWSPVLVQYPGLRLDLAHAGGIGGWEEETFAFLATQRDRQVYVDVSNHDGRKVPAFMERVVAYTAGDRAWMRERLMFGTDYWFLHMHADPQDFVDRYLEEFEDRGLRAVLPRFVGSAAQEFLGFDDTANKNRIRVIDRLRRLHAAEPFTVTESMRRALALGSADIARITGET